MLALGWLVGFFVLFFWATPQLPNNSEFLRTGLLAQSPAALLDAVDPPQERMGWRYLPQRFGVWVTAAWMLLGAWGLGRLAWRLITRGDRGDSGLNAVDGLTVFVLTMGVGLSALSLLTLVCGLVGALDRRVVVGVPVAALLAELVWWWR
ncbi:MAG: hypothetical protein VYA62_05755, partial [Planctomycetota bacterium]|nr:hypothetical protein [Planctomycetota bacterium]